MKRICLLFLFVFVACNQASKENSANKLAAQKTVAIQPYDQVSKAEIDTLAKAVADFYNLKVIILPKSKLPKTAFVNIKTPRFRADSIIRYQNRIIPKNADYLLGITHKDISVTKTNEDGTIKEPKWKYADFGIMGLAYRPGRSAIVSNYRLKHTNPKVVLERFKKVAIHEFGHNLGLPHCPNSHCVMTSANEKVTTIDDEKMELCSNCKLLLHWD